MPARDMKSALGTSLKAEQEAIKHRFERAENVLARNSSAPAVSAAATDRTQGEPAEGMRVKRDSFTMPAADYEQIARLQQRCLHAGQNVSKSEILRAGLLALGGLSDDQLIAQVSRLPKVKTGRRPREPFVNST